MDRALNLPPGAYLPPLSGGAWRITRSGILRLWVLLLLTLGSLFAGASAWSSTAFYYGSKPPIAELSAYDRVVLEPSLVTAREVRRLADSGTRVHAYVSVGEMAEDDPLYSRLPAAALPGSNPAWQTRVADLRHSAWRSHILEARIEPLAEMGFQGAFLDTLDSHHLLEDPESQRLALSSLISEIQIRHPSLELILNRGFEVLAGLHSPVAAVAVESLYQGWDAAEQRYRQVPDSDRTWLLARLAEARAYTDEIVVIDYAPFAAVDEREDLARRIIDAGFDAWVAEPTLVDIGTSDLVPVPRRIMIVHAESESLLTERDVHVMFGVVFDWLGYVVEYHDIRQGPPLLIQGVHAGVVSWLESGAVQALNWFENWLLEVVDGGYPLVILATLPTESERVLDRLGLSSPVLNRQANRRTVAERIIGEPQLAGTFEAQLRLRRYEVPPVRSTEPGNRIDLEIELTGGERVAPIVTGQWGGLALHPYLVEDYGEGKRRWLLDPYRFLTRALGHTARPVFDTTTENGSRLLTVHVDGDGFPSRAFLPGSPLSADVLLDEFITAYDLPHTVSVIEGEVGPSGLYPEQAAQLEDRARAVFQAPNVEIASHSFSHPFYWRPESLTAEHPQEYGMNLPIPGYEMDLSREIDGSIDYINGSLAPAGKQVEVFLWTGSADPDDRALAMLESRGVLNVNGGNTNVVAADESHLNVWPQARLENGALQIYAAAMNENVYTNNWTGPFYGYRKAIETFELTDQPRRLKPISIYYHFYSATKPASIRALHEVYDWALAQDVLPLYLSEFARRVKAYHDAWLYRDLAGGWVAGNLGPLRTIRYPQALGYAHSSGRSSLAGYRAVRDVIYLHLNGERAEFSFSDNAPEGPLLEKANVPVGHWQDQGAYLSLRLAGARPVRFSVHSATPCELTFESGVVVGGSPVAAIVDFSIDAKDTGNARLVCR